MYYKDLTGQTFGNLTAIRYMGTHEQRGAAWLCRCVCGAEVIKSNNVLKAGQKSCSAKCGVTASNKARATHGQAAQGGLTKEYAAWVSMKQRCHNPKCKQYAFYGGRGITVSPEWDTFAPFFAHIGAAPTKAHTIDRIDNSRGYEPGNVRWATRKEQSNNIRSNVRIVHQGRDLTLAEWAEALDIPLPMLYKRARKEGPVASVLRPRTSRVRNTLYEYAGEKRTITEWAKHLALPYHVVHERITTGKAIR